jgi:hypothetical protein
LENKILHGVFESIQPYNSSFKSVKIRIFAFNKNRNRSNITEESYLLAAPSLFNCPIVSKYIEDETDSYGLSGELSGHNVTLKTEIDEETGNTIYSIYNDTFPIGLIPNSAKVYYEDVNEGTEENPDIKTYVVAEGCLLWMRYDASQKIEEWLSKGIIPQVSMEIKIISGSVESDYYKVNSFEFEAVCALSSKKEACFLSSNISTYTKENFEKSYTEMLKELKELTQLELNQQNQNPSPTPDNVDLTNIDFKKENPEKEGGTKNLDEKLKLVTKYSNLTEDDIKDLKINIDKYSLEEFETELKKISESKFEMTNEQLITAIRQTLSEEKIIKNDYYGNPYESQLYYFMDIKGTVVIVIDNEWTNYFGVPFTTNGDTVVLDYTNKVAYLPDWRIKETASSEFSIIKEIVDAQIKFSVEKAIQKAKQEYETTDGSVDVDGMMDEMMDEMSSSMAEEMKTAMKKSVDKMKKKLKKGMKDKSMMSLEDSQEYKDLQSKYSTLEIDKNDLQSKFSNLESEKSTLESEKQNLETEKSTLETKCSTYEAENVTLKTFKETTIATQRKESEDALFELFSEKLTEDEIKPVKEVAANFTLEQLEEKLYVLVAKKTTKFEHIKKPKVDFAFEKEIKIIETGKPYDDIVSQYVVNKQ